MVLSHLLLECYLLPFRILLLSLSQVAFLDVVAVEHFFQLHICADKLSNIDVIHILFTVEICLISHTTFLEDNTSSVYDLFPLIIVHVHIHRQFVA